MEELLTYRITWFSFLLWSALIIGGYIVLQSANRLWPSVSLGQNLKGRIKQALHYALIIYEPAGIVFVGSLFVLWNPPVHGSIIGVLLLVGFPHIKNYVSGRIVRFDQAVTSGIQLRTGEVKGIVAGLGNMGLQLKTNEGMFYITYSSLLADGYTLLSGDEVGGFYHLRIIALEKDKEGAESPSLMDLLAVTPYLDWNHKPEWIPPGGAREHPEARVLLREENHLYELRDLMKEWGYQCRLVKEKQ